MTEEEKSGIVHEVVEEIKRQSQDASELEVSTNIEDFTSLPVVDREGRLKRFSVSELRRELGASREVEIVQATGDAEDKVMSQKAVSAAVGDVSGKVADMKTEVDTLNEGMTGAAQTIQEMQRVIETHDTSLNDLTTRVGSVETSSASTIAEMAAVKVSVEEAKAAAESVKASTSTTDGKTLEDVYTLAKEAANRAPAAPNSHHVLSQTEKNRITWATYLRNNEASSAFLQVETDKNHQEVLRLASSIAEQSDKIHGILSFMDGDLIGDVEKIGNKTPIFSSMSSFARYYRTISSDNFYRRLIKPLVDKGTLSDKLYVENECYYQVFFDNRVSIIVLNPYDNDDLIENEYWEPVDYNESYPQVEVGHTYTYDENTPVFINYRSYTKHSFRLKKSVKTNYGEEKDNTLPRFRTGTHICFSQKQLEWLCECLQDRFDSFMIASPAPLCQGMTLVNGKFSHEPEHHSPIDERYPTAMETDVIKEIMKAYTESRQLNIKVRYKEDGPAAYLNTQTDEEGHKYAFTLSYQFRSNGDEFKGFLGGPTYIYKEGLILRDGDSGFYSVLPPLSYSEVDSHKLNDFRFNVIGLGSSSCYDGDGLNPLLCRIARIGYDIAEDGSLDDVLELKKN